MALITSLRKGGGGVVRIVRSLIVLQVTSNTRGAGEIVVIIEVAVGALARGHGVPAGQWKSHNAVVEFRIQPVVHPVANIAIRGEVGGDVIRVRRLLEIRCVAGIAGRRHRLEPAVRSTLVAGVAVHRGMRSDQGEAVIVLLDLPHRHLPPEHGVALFAICAQLPPVNIRVAILAALANIGKDGLDMTLCAGHRPVHAAKRITGLIVIEFRNRADGSPGI